MQDGDTAISAPAQKSLVNHPSVHFSRGDAEDAENDRLFDKPFAQCFLFSSATSASSREKCPAHLNSGYRL